MANAGTLRVVEPCAHKSEGSGYPAMSCPVPLAAVPSHSRNWYCRAAVRVRVVPHSHAHSSAAPLRRALPSGREPQHQLVRVCALANADTRRPNRYSHTYADSDATVHAPPPSLRPTSTPRPVVPLPHVVEAWQDAVVAVRVESDRGRATEQMGLVVGPEGRVLTVMRFTAEVGAITVDVPGGGSFAGEMERVDPRTGATLLCIAASGLVAAPAPEPSLLTAQRVLFIDRDRTTREIMVPGSIASPSVNDADKVFALPPGRAPTPRLGTLVTDTEGVPLGLAGVQRAWWGVQVCLPQGLHPARRSRPCCSRLPSCC